MNVFVVFKFFEQLVEHFALLSSHFFEVVRNAFKLGADDFKFVFFEVFLNVRELIKCAVDYPFFVFSLEFVNAEVDEFEFEFFEFDAIFWLEVEHTFVVEEERKRA